MKRSDLVLDGHHIHLVTSGLYLSIWTKKNKKKQKQYNGLLYSSYELFSVIKKFFCNVRLRCYVDQFMQTCASFRNCKSYLHFEPFNVLITGKVWPMIKLKDVLKTCSKFNNLISTTLSNCTWKNRLVFINTKMPVGSMLW